MKKVFQLLLVLFIFYYIFRILFNFFFDGYELKYSLKVSDNEFKIIEKYFPYSRGEKKSYFFNISFNDKDYKFRVYDKLKGKRKKIVDIKYISDLDYECVLPIFANEKIYTNILCSDNGNMTYYYNIKGKSTVIDNFYKDFDVSKNEKDLSEKVNLGTLEIYPNNFSSHLHLMVSSYKGIYAFNKGKIDELKVFDKDIYSQKIYSGKNNLYFIVDYSKEDTGIFSNAYVVDYKNKKIDKMNSIYKISFDGYVQGLVDDSIYYLDTKNKVQYEFNIETKKIVIAGNEARGIKIYNGKRFDVEDYYDVVNDNLSFKYNDYIYDKGNFSKLIGGVKTGYHYKFVKKDNKYSVYKYFDNDDYLIYLFDISNIDNLNFVSNYIVYTEDEYIKIFDELKGINYVGKYEEFKFNKDIHVLAFSDK